MKDVSRLLNEIECRDVVFRLDYDSEKRKGLLPWIFQGREQFRTEEDIIFQKLIRKQIDFNTALNEITKLMEKYYGAKYYL